MTAGRHRATGRSRRRPAAHLVLAALAAALLGAVQVPGAQGAFRAAVRNTADTAATATYFTCQAAEQGDASTATIFEYPLGDSASSTVAADTSINTTKRNGTYTANGVTPGVANGPPAVCPRDGRTVATFSGYSLTGGYITGPSQAAPSAFSIEVWFRTSTAAGRLIGFSGPPLTTDDRHLYVGANGSVNFGVVNGLTRTVISSSSAVTDGAWHDAVATFSPTAGMALYLDGKLQATNTGVTTAAAYSGSWRLGYDSLALWPNTAAVNPGYFTGSMAFAAAYTTVLGADQIAAHYRAGS